MAGYRLVDGPAVPADGTVTASATCAPGEVAPSGGYRCSQDGYGCYQELWEARVLPDGQTFRVSGSHDDGGVPRTLTVSVVCVGAPIP